MIDRIISCSIRHRWLVVLAALLLALWGVRAAFRTPVDAIPDLSENQVIIFTEWPGHGPREIEDRISYPLSLELKGLDGVHVVRSSSDVGFSMITVVFQDRIGWEPGRRQVEDVLTRLGGSWPAGAQPRLAPDAVILLKGSRGVRLERLVPHIRAWADPTAAPSATPPAH